MDYQKKAFEVEISNGGPRGYETAITLKLPATWAEFHDALQKARIPDGRNCGIELTRSWWAGLSSELIGGAQNLYELNLFARRLTMLTSVELLSMDGLLKMEQARGTKSIPIPRLINLTFNADCHILPDVFNDESLGAFLYENEMLTKEAMCLLDTTEIRRDEIASVGVFWRSLAKNIARPSAAYLPAAAIWNQAERRLRKCIGLVRWPILTGQALRWCWK